jgi:uncharacterized membrane protein HdeD (DUF308 family)
MGLLLLTRPIVGLASLTLILIVYFLVEGIFEIMAALQLRPLQGWGWMLCSGIFSVILAGFFWSEWPLSGAWAIGVLVGIQLIFAGWSMISLGRIGRGLAGIERRIY